MEWITSIRMAIDYMEAHLTEDIGSGDVANHVCISPMYLQKGFQIMTGYTPSEYIRNRRLYLAAIELQNTDLNILDIALKYGYENQSSFDKAFTRFHGSTPREVKRTGHMQSFLPLKINIEVTGGENMKFRIEKKDEIKVIGFKRGFTAETSYQMIPKFWGEMMEKYCSHLMKGQAPVGEMETFIMEHHIGELGVCMDGDDRTGDFDYMIAGYDDGKVLDTDEEKLSQFVVPAGTWAIFECTEANLQETNTRIFKEWLPGNTEFELTGFYNVEWYSPDSKPGSDMKCEIWVPVIPK